MGIEAEVYNILLRGFLPQRFSWLVIGIEVLGILASFMIGYLSYKGYKLTQDKKYKYFMFGFLFLGLNFLSHITLNIMTYFGYFTKTPDMIVALSLFGLYYFFLIASVLAYLTLAIVYANTGSKKWTWLFYFWAFVIGAYAFQDQITLNLVSAIPLSFIVVTTFDKYTQTKNKNLLMISSAFLCLFAFHIFVMVELQSIAFYVARYVILLAGLVLMFKTLINIFYGRKKK